MLNFNEPTAEDKVRSLEQEARNALRNANAFDDVDIVGFMRVVGPQLADVDNPKIRAAALANAVEEFKNQRPREFRNVPNFRDPNVDPEKAVDRYIDDLRNRPSETPLRVNWRDPNLDTKKAMREYKARMR